MTTADNAAGLEEVAPGVFAYLQKGGWGFSNAGLVTSAGQSLLVDTLYDLRLTKNMLEAMRRAACDAAHIGVVVNTHANGDHCWGNQLLEEATIISSKAAAEEMLELSPALMATLLTGSRAISKTGSSVRALLHLLGRVGVPRVAALADAASFLVDNFGSFEFRGISLKAPTQTFQGQLSLTVGDKRVQLIEVGPAHTKGDAIVYLPTDRIAFAGDILFIGSHPIAWAGPIDNWIAACDRLLALDVDVIVPGHGTITDKTGVRKTKEYWQHLLISARRGYEQGASPEDIARTLISDGFVDWSEPSRLVVNIDTIFRRFSGDTSARDPLVALARIARLR